MEQGPLCEVKLIKSTSMCLNVLRMPCCANPNLGAGTTRGTTGSGSPHMATSILYGVTAGTRRKVGVIRHMVHIIQEHINGI